jgi:hypothetical protein
LQEHDSTALCFDYGVKRLKILMLYSSENCVKYLTAWGVDIDAQDNEGCTALHHAAMGVLDTGNVHIIMALLVGGADRSIKVIILNA